MERYYSYSRFLKETFGEKVYKISIDGGFTCPNRDGTLSEGGCIFCSEGGSGDYAESSRLSVSGQIARGKGLYVYLLAADISPIFRRLPTLTDRWNDSGLSMRKPSHRKRLPPSPSEPGRTVFLHRSLISWKKSTGSNRFFWKWACRPATIPRPLF